MVWHACPKIQMEKLVIGWDRTQPVDVLSCCANHCATGHLMHLNAIGAFCPRTSHYSVMPLYFFLDSSLSTCPKKWELMKNSPKLPTCPYPSYGHRPSKKHILSTTWYSHTNVNKTVILSMTSFSYSLGSRNYFLLTPLDKRDCEPTP